MIEKLTGKKYYRITFTLDSPLALGSGENHHTDKDLMLDSAGKPYIPASSLAGVVCHALESSGAADPEKIKKYLGDIKKATSDSNDTGQWGSRILFYDAVLDDGSPCHIVTRDSVALDDFKTAKKGAKFDMEVLEAGASFHTFLEQDLFGDGEKGKEKDNDAENDDIEKDDIEKDDIENGDIEEDFGGYIAELLAGQGICFGGKTMRGYGAVRDVAVGQKSFSFRKQEELDRWLAFDVYTEQTWDSWAGNGKEHSKEIVLKLQQAGGISIRRYTTAVKPANEIRPQPDYEQLTAHGFYERQDGNNGQDEASALAPAVPVIPGTSWAGAFRHRMKEFGIDVNGQNSIFGYVSKEKAAAETGGEKITGKEDRSEAKKKIKNKKRSRIRFSESRIEGAAPRILSRNAIDRFSGGTVDRALFTEKTWYGGTCELRISWHDPNSIPEAEKKALAASIADLHFGFLAVGGETSVGRGLFRITSVDDEEINAENEKDIYQITLRHIGEKMK